MPDEATENSGSTSARVSSFFIEDLLGTEGAAGGGARRAAAGGGGRGAPRSPLRLGAPGCPLRDAAVGWYRRAHAAFLGCTSPDSKSLFPAIPFPQGPHGVWGVAASQEGPVLPRHPGKWERGGAAGEPLAALSPCISPGSGSWGKSPETLPVWQAPGASAPPAARPKM